MRIDTDKEVPLKNNKDRDRIYKKFSDEQKEMFQSIQDNVFTFCEATSGAGKTLVTIASMLDLLANSEINKIIYIQKASDRYLSQGFRPGTIEEKTDDLWTPFYDAMATLGYMPDTIMKLIKFEQIILITDSSLRGVNFESVGVCVDEAQNMDIETLRLIFTRCHDNCHIAMIGDSRQKDNKGNKTKDFIAYGDYLSDSSLGNKCVLTKNFRGKFSQLAETFGE